VRAKRIGFYEGDACSCQLERPLIVIELFSIKNYTAAETMIAKDAWHLGFAFPFVLLSQSF
jgi:hypothetical protein